MKREIVKRIKGQSGQTRKPNASSQEGCVARHEWRQCPTEWEVARVREPPVQEASADPSPLPSR